MTADDELVRRARAVLDRNRRGAYTCPSVTLYPHQWLWDSCFTAIGIARYDPARACDRVHRSDDAARLRAVIAVLRPYLADQ